MRIVLEPKFGISAEGLVESGFLPEIQAFIKAVQTGDRKVVQSDIAASYRSMLLHDTIVESAHTGRWVELKYEI